MLCMEYEDLQRAWQSFIEDRELSLEVKTATTHTAKESVTETNPEPPTQLSEAQTKLKLHIYANHDTLKRFTEGYQKDKTFKALITRA